MREIKFRAWDKIKNRILEVRVIDWLNGMVDWPYPYIERDWSNNDEVILMQYTGIRDKNGKEIYEGDILSGIAFYNGNDYGGPVKKEEYYICKDVVFSEGCYMCGGFALNEISRYMEVIGNIYKNPELMRREKE